MKAFPELPLLETCCCNEMSSAACAAATSTAPTHSNHSSEAPFCFQPSLICSWGTPWGHRDPNRIPCHRWSLSPLGAVGFLLTLGHPCLALAVVVGTQTGLSGSSAACSGLLWAFCHGKGLLPGSVGAGEAEVLLELRCCCPRASSCCFVTGFGGAGRKSVGLPLPCQAQGTPCTLVLNPPAPGETQGQGHLRSGWCWEGGMLVKRSGCLWAHMYVQHS